MIEIRLRHGNPLTIAVDGHAEYADHGQDIVCAAVSAIVQTAMLGLVEIANKYPDHVCVIDD